MVTLLTEMTTSYERASPAERYRVLPFLLSTVNKILSKSSSRSGSDASSDTSHSASTLAAIQCFCSSLKGLTTVDLCVPPSANTGNDQSSCAAPPESLGDRNDSNCSDSDSSKNNSKNSSQNNSSCKEHVEQSDNNPFSSSFSFSEHLNSPAVTEGIEQFVRNKEAISRTIFLLTICMESVKGREMQNRVSQENRSVAVYKESRDISKSSDDNNIDNDNDDDDDSECQDNEELDKDKQKQQRKHSNNNNNTNNSTNNIDAQYPMKRQLNGDDDAIICTGFEALRTAQILWSLSADVKKTKEVSNKERKKTSNERLNEPFNTLSNNASTSSINQHDKDNLKAVVVDSDKSAENKNYNNSSFLKPFSSIFLAQLVQFSLFFSAQR